MWPVHRFALTVLLTPVTEPGGIIRELCSVTTDNNADQQLMRVEIPCKTRVSVSLWKEYIEIISTNYFAVTSKGDWNQMRLNIKRRLINSLSITYVFVMNYNHTMFFSC